MGSVMHRNTAPVGSPPVSIGSSLYPGWKTEWSSQHQKYYYVHLGTGDSTWIPPVATPLPTPARTQSVQRKPLPSQLQTISPQQPQPQIQPQAQVQSPQEMMVEHDPSVSLVKPSPQSLPESKVQYQHNEPQLQSPTIPDCKPKSEIEVPHTGAQPLQNQAPPPTAQYQQAHSPHSQTPHPTVQHLPQYGQQPQYQQLQPLQHQSSSDIAQYKQTDPVQSQNSASIGQHQQHNGPQQPQYQQTQPPHHQVSPPAQYQQAMQAPPAQNFPPPVIQYQQTQGFHNTNSPGIGQLQQISPQVSPPIQQYVYPTPSQPITQPQQHNPYPTPPPQNRQSYIAPSPHIQYQQPQAQRTHSQYFPPSPASMQSQSPQQQVNSAQYLPSPPITGPYQPPSQHQQFNTQQASNGYFQQPQAQYGQPPGNGPQQYMPPPQRMSVSGAPPQSTGYGKPPLATSQQQSQAQGKPSKSSKGMMGKLSKFGSANPQLKKWGTRAAMGIGAITAVTIGVDIMDGGLFDGADAASGLEGGGFDGSGMEGGGESVEANAARLEMEQIGQENASMLADPVGTTYTVDYASLI